MVFHCIHKCADHLCNSVLPSSSCGNFGLVSEEMIQFDWFIFIFPLLTWRMTEKNFEYELKMVKEPCKTVVQIADKLKLLLHIGVDDEEEGVAYDES